MAAGRSFPGTPGIGAGVQARDHECRAGARLPQGGARDSFGNRKFWLLKLYFAGTGILGIIIAKLKGRVAEEVVARLRNMAKQFADDGVALLIQHDDFYVSPKIHFEITDLGVIDGGHVQRIVETLFIEQKGKGVRDASVMLSFKEQRFALPDDFDKCMKYIP